MKFTYVQDMKNKKIPTEIISNNQLLTVYDYMLVHFFYHCMDFTEGILTQHTTQKYIRNI